MNKQTRLKRAEALNPQMPETYRELAIQIFIASFNDLTKCGRGIDDVPHREFQAYLGLSRTTWYKLGRGENIQPKPFWALVERYAPKFLTVLTAKEQPIDKGIGEWLTELCAERMSEIMRQNHDPRSNLEALFGVAPTTFDKMKKGGLIRPCELIALAEWLRLVARTKRDISHMGFAVPFV